MKIYLKLPKLPLYLPGDVHATVPTMRLSIENELDVNFVLANPRSPIIISKSSSPSLVLPTDLTKMFLDFMSL